METITWIAIVVLIVIEVCLIVLLRQSDLDKESPDSIYKRGYDDALAAREPDAETYKRGFEDGYRIANLNDKATSQEVAAALREPVKQKPVPPEVLKEQKRIAAIMQNIANTGTNRRQIDVE